MYLKVLEWAWLFSLPPFLLVATQHWNSESSRYWPFPISEIYFFIKFLFWLFGSSRGPLFLPRPHFLPPSLPPSYSFFLLPPPFRSVPHISLPRSSSSLLLLPFLPNVLPKHKGEGGKGRCVAKVRNPNNIKIKKKPFYRKRKAEEKKIVRGLSFAQYKYCWCFRRKNVAPPRLYISLSFSLLP